MTATPQEYAGLAHETLSLSYPASTLGISRQAVESAYKLYYGHGIKQHSLATLDEFIADRLDAIKGNLLDAEQVHELFQNQYPHSSVGVSTVEKALSEFGCGQDYRNQAIAMIVLERGDAVSVADEFGLTLSKINRIMRSVNPNLTKKQWAELTLATLPVFEVGHRFGGNEVLESGYYVIGDDNHPAPALKCKCLVCGSVGLRNAKNMISGLSKTCSISCGYKWTKMQGRNDAQA